MRVVALLLAAGRGERMGTEEPKAFLRVADRTLLEWAVAAVDACPDVEGFCVVAPPGLEDRATQLANSVKLLGVRAGGETRQESVRLGLEALQGGVEIVLCHDVARPLAPPKLFSEVLKPLEWGADAAVPVVPVVDSIKRMREGDMLTSLPRDGLYSAQTPQAIRRSVLEAAYGRAAELGVNANDEAELIELVGLPAAEPVRGDPTNIKVTRREDLRVAEVLLEMADE